jgi:hypothetical protein
MNLTEARNIAVENCYKLQPFCDRINIAGSVRRKKEFVKDIEIVCQPKKIITSQDTLFGGGEGIEEVHPDFIKTVNSLGEIVKGKPTGKYMKIKLKTVTLDLFTPDAFDYYRQYAIRTGSAQFAQMVIATGWLKRGWCGTPDGLRLQNECEGKKGPDGKAIWKCKVKKPTLPPVWQSEEDFFEWIGAPYLPAERRFM